MQNSAEPSGEADDVRSAVAPLHCHGVTAGPEALRSLRHELVGWAIGAELGADRAQDIALASYEALANVADHAYNGERGTVDLDAYLYPGRVEVVITDHGHWRTPVLDPRPVTLRGRGLMLLHASADRADIQTTDEGTVVVLAWDIP